MTPVRTVVVGYGMAGRQFHCYLVGLTPGLTLRGVVSRSEQTRERIRAEQQCIAYESLEHALGDPDVQLVVIATPNSTHADLAVQAMEAGRHVVSDKVMCLTLSDCDRMAETARRAGVVLSAFQNRRFDGDYLTVRGLIEQGRLGDVRWLEVAWQGFRPWGGWRGRADMGGGKLYDLGAHLVDQACMIFPGAVESVYCRMHHDYPQTDTESEALVVIAFDGGQTAVCDFSSMAAQSKPRFYVRGTRGTFRKHGLDPQEAAMKAGDIGAAVEPEALYGVLHNGITEERIPTLAGRWRNYYENIAAVISNGAAPAVRLCEVRREIAVLEAAMRSARTGDVVHRVAEAL